jgi:hypothetical protein
VGPRSRAGFEGRGRRSGVEESTGTERDASSFAGDRRARASCSPWEVSPPYGLPPPGSEARSRALSAGGEYRAGRRRILPQHGPRDRPRSVLLPRLSAARTGLRGRRPQPRGRRGSACDHGGVERPLERYEHRAGRDLRRVDGVDRRAARPIDPRSARRARAPRRRSSGHPVPQQRRRRLRGVDPAPLARDRAREQRLLSGAPRRSRGLARALGDRCASARACAACARPDDRPRVALTPADDTCCRRPSDECTRASTGVEPRRAARLAR